MYSRDFGKCLKCVEYTGRPITVGITMKSTHLLLTILVIITAGKIPHKVTSIHLVDLPAKHKFQVVRKIRHLGVIANS